jgi:hypothetical protein
MTTTLEYRESKESCAICGHTFRFVLHKGQRPVCASCREDEWEIDESECDGCGKMGFWIQVDGCYVCPACLEEPEPRHADESRGHFID